MKKLLVVYRDNSLFAEYLPAMLDIAEKEVEVIRVVFPAGTEQATIKASLLEKLAGVSGIDSLICDRTCEGVAYESTQIPPLGLDYLFQKATVSLFKSTTKKNFVDNLKSLIWLLCEDEIMKVVVVAKSSTDHLDGEMYDEFRRGTNWDDNRGMMEKEEKMAEFLAESMKEILPKSSVEIHTHPQQHYVKDVVVIADRHSKASGESMLVLPFENTVMQLQKTGRFEPIFDPVALWSIARKQCGIV